jgi:hypothetical protein
MTRPRRHALSIAKEGRKVREGWREKRVEKSGSHGLVGDEEKEEDPPA